MNDDAFVLAAYLVTAFAVMALVGFVFLDQRGRRRELAELEAMGIRRRSARRRDGEGTAP
ncbi:heme exporter protein CcmD [Pararhizobium mangrovi]|uniref:Heme exporter protein D n=1 Tax=Pararhizobium mangrovi TaxID=2590452 RepID=A0A506U1A4_9HYPH|nr:heme exporter protein CcmD [Pararhizobium mangrovi]TPW27011.1 heme exporter protein CcmD [Pararhizobium mangrovi]